MKKHLITTILLLIFISSNILGQETSCSDVLSGLYNYEQREFDESFWERYIKEIDEKKFSSLESFKEHNTSIGVAIPITKLPIDFSFNNGGKVIANNQDYNSFREFVDKNIKISKSFKEEFKTVNEHVATKWLACMQNKRFISWYTRNGKYLSLHLKRGQFSINPLVLRLKEIEYSGENLKLLGEEKERDSKIIHKKKYRWKIIGGGIVTINFEIQNIDEPSYITLITSNSDYRAHHEIRAIIPDPPVVEPPKDNGPERHVITLDGGVYMTRGYWAKGQRWTDFKCHTPIPSGYQLVILSERKENIGKRHRESHCGIDAGYCNGLNEHCENIWFKKACFVNNEWVEWYKQYCMENNIPYTKEALCEQ